MLARITVIALNTYREAVRARVLHGLFGLALATVAYSLVVGAFAARNTSRVVADLGSASLSMYGVVVAVVLGATSLHRELELKTVFPILARPIRRWEYLIGKFLGTWLTMAVFTAGNAAVLLLALAQVGDRPISLVLGVTLGSIAVAGLAAWRRPRWRTYLPMAWALLLVLVAWQLASVAPDDRRVVAGSAALTLCEVAVVTAIATVFSSFSSPFLTAMLTLGLFVVGRSADTLAHLPVKVFGQTIQSIGQVLSHVVPNLMVYVPPRPLLTGESLSQPLGTYLLLASAQALLWSIGLLAAASLIFRRRDFL